MWLAAVQSSPSSFPDWAGYTPYAMAGTRIVNSRFMLTTDPPKGGGMADVYRALDSHDSGRAVAVKVLRSCAVENEILQEVFRRETSALSNLRHPNIVELIDHGFDAATGEYFLALEWVQTTLQDVVREHPFAGWDSFAEEVALPLFRAMDLAHGRGIAHRDIKPTNILMTGDGVPKLADFGIAKLRHTVDTSVTVREFVSRPYAPPEDDDYKHQFARDVYALAAICIFALADKPIRTAEDLTSAASGLDVPEDVRLLLIRCLSRLPQDRPASAGVVLNLFESIHKKRSSAWAKAHVCHIRWSESAQQAMARIFETSDESQLQRRLLTDLSGSAHIGVARDRGPDDPDNSRARYRIIGNCLDMYVDVDRAAGDHLYIRKIVRRAPSEMDRGREASWLCPFAFRFGRPTNTFAARSLIDSIAASVLKFDQESIASADQVQRQRLFDRWRNVLKALDKIQRDRQPSLAYSSWEREPLGGIKFSLATSSPAIDIIGDRWKVDANTSVPMWGEVVSADANRIWLSLSSEVSPPKKGKLRLDTAAADEAIRRQRDTVNEVQNAGGGLLRPDLADLLVSPGKARVPGPSDIKFILDLDPPKQDAVRAALGIKDFLLVQGPPGTGKTAFIAETILQYLTRNQDTSILLSSQTHVALDNAIDRIRKAKSEIKILRIGNPTSEKVLQSVRPLLMDQQLPRWTDEVSALGQQFIGDWAEKRGLPKLDVQQALFLRLLALEARTTEQLESLRSELERQLGSTKVGSPTTPSEEGDVQSPRDDLEARLDEVRKRLSEASRRRRLTEGRLREISKVWDGISKMPPAQIDTAAQGLIPEGEHAKQLIDLLTLHPLWCDRLGNRRGLESAVLAHYDVVAATCIGLAGVPGFRDVDFDLCIVDEASKATATEALVPLARSKAWILVGDDRQLPPFQGDLESSPDILDEFHLTADAVKETLFDRMVANLPDGCTKTLTLQHRMVAPIGNLISRCFYDGELSTARADLEPTVTTAFGHPVTWWSTSRIEQRREQRDGSSYSNQVECVIVSALLERLNRAVGPEYEREKKHKCSVALLTAYTGQQRRLERDFSAKQRSLPHLNVVVNTVDAFQGQEADVAIFSAVRSNTMDSFGFLRDFERLNVALSRGRDGLVIVGDSEFFRRRPLGNPLFEVLRYLDTAPTGCYEGAWTQ